MSKMSILTILALALVIGLAAVTVSAQTGPQPVSGAAHTAQPDVAQPEAVEALDVYFLSTGLTPEMEGHEIGQIVLFAAEFCPGGVCATDELGLVRAFTEPFSDTVRVWVEHRAATEPIIVSFRSREGYGLGQCEIAPAGTARLWGWCEYDPVGDYEATQIFIHFPARSMVGGLAAARPGSWKAPEYQVFIPFIER